jgi:hypothetical protein
VSHLFRLLKLLLLPHGIRIWGRHVLAVNLHLHAATEASVRHASISIRGDIIVCPWVLRAWNPRLLEAVVEVEGGLLVLEHLRLRVRVLLSLLRLRLRLRLLLR